MSKRPGFYSATGVVVAAVLLVVVVAWTVASAHADFSPGALNAETTAASAGGGPAAGAASAGGGTGAGGARTLGGVASHAALKECAACHPAPWSSQTMADACLDCHVNVAAQIRAGKGLHGDIAGTPPSPTCDGCHPEHNGPHGALTDLSEVTFPHDGTGFSLRTHQRMADGSAMTCAECHAKDYTSFGQAICTDCHARIDAAFTTRHVATFGKDCLACHDGTGRDGAGFDHSKTSFALTGKHADVPCKDCHSGARSSSDLLQTPHDCYSCHAKDDEHNGSFGRQCGQCHNATGWGDVNFDHSVFPLDHGSEERKASCTTCHPQGTSTYTCFGCHAHTTANVLAKHEGRSLATLRDCIRCHPGGQGGGD